MTTKLISLDSTHRNQSCVHVLKVNNLETGLLQLLLLHLLLLLVSARSRLEPEKRRIFNRREGTTPTHSHNTNQNLVKCNTVLKISTTPNDSNRLHASMLFRCVCIHHWHSRTVVVEGSKVQHPRPKFGLCCFSCLTFTPRDPAVRSTPLGGTGGKRHCM